MITQALFRATCVAALSFSCIAFSTNGNAQIITTIAGSSSSGFSGDGGPSTAAQVLSTNSVATDAAGNVYIYDLYRLRKINTSGVINTVAGIGAPGSGGDGGPATAAQIEPGAVGCDVSGNIYLCAGNKIRKITTSGIITTIAGTGSAGYGGDGGAATAAQFNNPTSLTIDGAFNIYIADAGNHRIRKINTSGIVTTIAGTGAPGFSGDGGSATAAKLNGPYAVAFDGGGNVIIADNNNFRIREINTAGIITTIAGTGTAGFGGDGGPATAAMINSVRGICTDWTCSIIVADWLNSRVRKITSSGIITTVAGSGSPGFSGDGGPATAAMLWAPNSVAADVALNFYIADGENNRVRKVGNITTSVSSSASLPNATLNVFPNPSNGSFTFRLTSKNNEEVDCSITDITGKMVKQITFITNKDYRLQSELPAGIYYLTAETKSGKVVEKIVVE